MDSFSEEDISFLGVYVDDILSIMNVDLIEDVEREILKDMGSLKLKITRENEFNEVDYLNTTIKRMFKNESIRHTILLIL